MKKLYNPFSNSSAFTLVELLVVISIIGVLSTMGYAVYSNTTADARDAKKRADIDAISKVLEDKYIPSTGLYVNSIVDTDFTSGKKPASTDYYLNFTSDNKAFVVCTRQLEKSTEQYCRYSANGSSAAVSSLSTALPECWGYPSLRKTSDLICNVKSSTSPPFSYQPFYISCSEATSKASTLDASCRTLSWCGYTPPTTTSVNAYYTNIGRYPPTKDPFTLNMYSNCTADGYTARIRLY